MVKPSWKFISWVFPKDWVPSKVRLFMFTPPVFMVPDRVTPEITTSVSSVGAFPAGVPEESDHQWEDSFQYPVPS